MLLASRSQDENGKVIKGLNSRKDPSVSENVWYVRGTFLAFHRMGTYTHLV